MFIDDIDDKEDENEMEGEEDQTCIPDVVRCHLQVSHLVLIAARGLFTVNVPGTVMWF